MLVVGSVSVIGLDDLIKEWSEYIVRVVRASINTNSGICPLASREDGLSEGETIFVSSVFALFPDLWSKALCEQSLH